MLSFAEEILLLILHEESGGAEALPETVWRPTLAGAALMELAVEGRIDTDFDSLTVTDPAPLGDTLLDPVLAQIAANAEPRDAAYWVGKIAEQAESIRDRASARMIGKSILAFAEDGSIIIERRVFRTRRYPAHNGKGTEQEVRLRIMRVLFGNDIPEPRDVVLIALASACGLFRRMLDKDELEQASPRIALVEKMDLIGRKVVESVRRSERAAAASAAPPPADIPAVKGLPFIGSALAARKDGARFLVSKHLEHGPVFEIRLAGIKTVVLAGVEANRLLEKKGRVYLRDFDVRQDFSRELRIPKILAAGDGKDHARCRQAMAAACSRTRFEAHAQTAADITRRTVGEWRPGQSMPAVQALRRIAAAQLSVILTGTPPGEYLEDVIEYLDTLLTAQAPRRLPMLLHARKFRRARRRVGELCGKMIAAHQPGGPLREAGDWINDVLDLHETDPQFMPETDLRGACMAPFLAGLDTAAATCAFMLYELLKHPQIMQRATAEADAFFAADGSMSDPDKLDVLRRAALETLRLYPPAPAAMRTSANSFDFAGCRIPANSAVLAANAAPHFLPELFPDPYRFDIDRYLPPREEHKQPHAYAPFGPGGRRCIGAGFAEAQIPLTVAAILHDAQLALDPPDYELKPFGLPALRPGKRLRFSASPRNGPADVGG